MKHIDPDVLALLALGEVADDVRDAEHLATCDECRTELMILRRAAVVGRSTIDAGELLEPSPRVWAAIQRDLAEIESDGGGDGEAVADPETGPASDPTAESAQSPGARVTPLRRRLWVPLAAAAAALVFAVAGGVWWATRPMPATVLASATLDAFPDWPDASASATVEVLPDGERVVEVDLDAPISDDGDAYRELWLISSEGDALVSLGMLDGTHGTFAIPADVDLSRFTLVDISQEHFDGDPGHSGDSIVRGELSPA